MAVTDLLNNEAAARVLGIAPITLTAWRRQGKGPKVIRVGQAVRYDPADIRAWLEAQRQAPGAYRRSANSRRQQPKPAESLADRAERLPPCPTFRGDPLTLQRALRDEWR